MDWPKTNCPNCNALQDFKYRHRKTDDNKWESYVKCSKCKKEWIISKYTDVQFSKKRRDAKRKQKKASGRRAEGTDSN
jgi:hypothetical protein